MKYYVSIHHDVPSMPKAFYTTLTYSADTPINAARKAREYIGRGGSYCEQCVHDLLNGKLIYRVKLAKSDEPATFIPEAELETTSATQPKKKRTMTWLKKAEISYDDYESGIVQKMWIVGQPLTPYPNADICLNYVAVADDPENHNEKVDCNLRIPPKYFTDFASARACAKFWNEKVPWKYDETQLVRRHEMLCAFKPHLVKVVMA